MKKNKIILVLCVLLGLMMINSGFNKFFNYMPMPKLTEEQVTIFGALMTLKWILPLVAVTEIVGGILVAIPKTSAFGAIVLLPVMIGIIAHHLTFDIAGIGVGLVLLLINVWVIFENKEKYEPMLKN